MSGKNTGHRGAPPGQFPGEADDSYEKTLVFEDAGVMGDEPGFAFETFTQSEADAAARAQARSQPPVEPQGARPERRPILRRSYLPPGDVVVDARPVGNMTVVTLRGRINESFRGAELGRSLSGTIVFDLAEVDRVSSFGVKGWLQMLETSRMTSCYFFRCSEAVINQITMMRNFCGPGHIHSLMVPYTCAHCGEEFGALYEAVADREYILGRSPAKVECPNCHDAAEMDDDPWSYFALDEHLLDQVPSDLQQVVSHLTSTNRIDPIEKFISEQETRIRFNAPLDGRLRLGLVRAHAIVLVLLIGVLGLKQVDEPVADLTAGDEEVGATRVSDQLLTQGGRISGSAAGVLFEQPVHKAHQPWRQIGA